MSDLRICKVCGNEYKYCPTCSKYANLPSWMWKCDTEECNELFDTISAYKMNVGDKNEIKNVLNKYNIKNYDKYIPSIKEFLTKTFPLYVPKKNKQKENNMDIELKEQEVDLFEFKGMSEE